MSDPSERTSSDRELADTIERRAARVVLIDQGDAVLLISARDSMGRSREQYWLTPGGGVEGDETLEEAARREVWEETGARIGDVGPVVWQRNVTFRFEGRLYKQHESFFVVRIDRFEVRPIGLTELEARSTTGWRWWLTEELQESHEAVYPAKLASLISDWLTSKERLTPQWIE